LRVVDGSCNAVLTGHVSIVLSISFSPNGKTLASGYSDGTVRLWNVKGGDGGCLVTLPEHHRECVLSVVFSPDGSNEGIVRLWNPKEHDRRNKPGNWDALIRLWHIPA
jgi:WD40 repeat protein